MNVDAAVAAETEWMVALLQRLVAAPTTLGHEEEGQAVMRDAFAACGLEPVDEPLDAEALRAHAHHSPFSWPVEGKRNVLATWVRAVSDPVNSWRWIRRSRRAAVAVNRQ